jgi:exopolysaccharide biosynthesis polyprenyl glycosylphosphotransferase
MVGTGSLFIVLDAASVIAAGLISYQLRDSLGSLFGIHQIGKTSLPHLTLLFLLVIYSLLTITCNAAQGLYSERVAYSADVARAKLARAFLVSSLLAVMVIFVSNEKAVPRLMFVTTSVISLLTLVTFRYLLQQRKIKLLERGVGAHHVLIVGGGPIANSFFRYLETHTYLGKKVCGFIDDTPQPSEFWLGTSAELPRILREHFVDEIYFTPAATRDVIINVALQARRERISVKVVPDLYDGLALGAGITTVGDVPLLELNHQPIPALGLLIKRFMDLAIAGSTAVVLMPLMVVTALAIKLDSQGPVLYAAWRVGRKGHKFRCYKFRTMVSNADARKDELRHLNERQGATFKIANDPRITRVGRFLRKYSIDEFPQLFNVLKGDMSVVGPRPHPVDDYHQYGLEDLRRLDVLPGLTGLWQVTARHDPSFQRNVELDLEYINNWNLSLDIKILLKTVPEVFRGSGH